MNQKSKWYGPKQIGVMILTAILMLFCACIVGGNNNTVFPAFSEAYGWDLDLMHVISGIGAMMLGVGVLVFSQLLKKVSVKKVVIFTLLLSGALILLQAYVKNFIVFIIAMPLLGFLGGGYERVGSTVITANWWPTKKGVVLGFTTMGIVAMNVVYVPFMPKLFASLGLNTGYGIVGIIFIILAIICIFVYKETPEEVGEYPDGDPNYYEEGSAREVVEAMKHYKSPFTVKRLLSIKETWLIGFGSAIAYMACMSFVASAIPTLLGYGYEMSFASTFFAVCGIIAFVGSFLFGLLDQKAGPKKAFIVFFIVMIVGFIFALFMKHSAIIVWITGIIMFMGQGAIANLTISYVTTIFGRWDYSAAWSLIGFVYAIGGGAGIMIVGLFSNPVTMQIFAIVCLVIGLIMIILSKDKLIGKKG